MTYTSPFNTVIDMIIFQNEALREREAAPNCSVEESIISNVDRKYPRSTAFCKTRPRV